MMYPRLKIAKTLLRDDGVIYISIDDNEVHNLRKLCDEVFGEENFIAELVWERAYAPKNDAKYVSNSHDYVLMYVRSINHFQIGRLPRTDEANARYQNPDNDPRGVWKPSDMSVKTYNPECDYPITTPKGRVVEPPTGRCWRLSKKAFLERLQDNRIYFGSDGNSVPCIKRFLTELKFEGMAPQFIFHYKDVGHSQEGAKEVTSLLEAGAFDGPKPIRLLNRLLILANTEPDSLILDFFSGSSSTAHAVIQLNAEDGGNRKFIMVQIPEPTDEGSEAYKAGYRTIANIGKERIRRAGDKIMAEWREKQSGQLSLENPAEQTSPPDTGFRVFKLDSSNMKKWDDAYVTPDQIDLLFDRMEQSLDAFKPDRRKIDVVYEVFIKYGVGLTEKLSTLDIQGKTFYAVGENGYLFICLDEGLTLEIVEEAAQYAPGTMIFADECFADSNVLTNVGLMLDKTKIEFRWI